MTASSRKISAMLLATALCCGTLDAQEIRLGSGAGGISDFVELEVLFDAQGSTEVASGTITLRYNASQLLLEERCRSRVGGTIFSTHRVGCGINPVLGIVTITFESLVQEVQQILSGRWSFGTVAVQLLSPTGENPDPLEVVIESVEFRDVNQQAISGLPQSDTGGLAYFVAGWPVDEFELDDSPAGAARFTGFVGQTMTGRNLVRQLHSFDTAQDEDWVIIQSSNSVMIGPQLTVRALPPQLPASFQPVVEIYNLDRLFDPAVTPVETIGDCNSSARELAVFPEELKNNRLLRIFNCVASPPEGLAYELAREFDVAVISGGISATGTVTEAGTGLPVQVVIFSDSNQIAVSNPLDGQYSIVLLAEQEATLTVVSDQYVAEPITIPELMESAFSDDNDIVVFRTPDAVFRSGFEATP